jgi:hypothetical protein
VKIVAKSCKSWEGCLVHCEIDIVVHVWNVEEDCLERELLSFVLLYYFFNHVLGSPFVGGLHPAEGPEGRELGLTAKEFLVLLDYVLGRSMHEEVYFELPSNSDVTQLGCPVFVEGDYWSHSVRVSKVDSEKVILTLAPNKHEWMYSVASLPSRSIIIRAWLTMCPHVPGSLLQSKFVYSFTEPENILRREIEVHLDELVHEN